MNNKTLSEADLHQYVLENAPDWIPDWSSEYQQKAYVSKPKVGTNSQWTFFVSTTKKRDGVVYMPVSAAVKLCNKLNGASA